MGDDRCLIYSSCNLFLSTLETPPDSFSSWRSIDRSLDSGPRKGDLAVVNLCPQAGEEKYFFGSRSNTPLTEDYSVIALVREFSPSQWVMILAGTTTLGTQAAVEFVCSENSLKDLLGRLNVSHTGQMKPFEAVLRVKVTRGVPVESNIVALRSQRFMKCYGVLVWRRGSSWAAR